ncbi:energy transducer TonB [Dethiosulfovibrio salsuginis]|uniref:TonB family C-terminal domain-containing protein n=1 Tax=Dethiosulfovibrio salsuginis TaxID=561720 RepID=A0A1X7KCZ3_9BACT|nr:energy transducer TonB [Dethiosulfovibrio salsuginis]SMG39092.1 TonB family C-terminal domain-containing protein [Dethiosulfovibrio salsuginis]
MRWAVPILISLILHGLMLSVNWTAELKGRGQIISVRLIPLAQEPGPGPDSPEGGRQKQEPASNPEKPSEPVQEPPGQETSKNNEVQKKPESAPELIQKPLAVEKPQERKVTPKTKPEAEPTQKPVPQKTPAKTEPKPVKEVPEKRKPVEKTAPKATQPTKAESKNEQVKPAPAPKIPPSNDGEGEEAKNIGTQGTTPLKTSTLTSAGAEGGKKSAQPKGIMSENDVTVIHREQPVYPLISRKRKEQGTVAVLLEVTSGKVSDAKVESSSGSPRLDESAVKALRAWRFSQDLTGTVRIPVVFTLTK